MDPTLDSIDIEDIAHTLSLLCRYGGHSKEFYSVAEHSIRCSEVAPEEFKLEALLHDASEAYLVDMPRPIKQVLPEYVALEKRIEKAVAEKFGLPYPMSPEVKAIDNRMLATEVRDILNEGERPISFLPEPYEFKIVPNPDAKRVEQTFLNLFDLYRS